MKLPFTTDQFFDVFRAYNEELWPFQILILLIGLWAVALVARMPLVAGRRSGRPWSRAVGVVLALLWSWMGLVYHLIYFSEINPAAQIFGIVFVIEASLLLALTLGGSLHFDVLAGKWRQTIGWTLLAYALAAYPAIGFLSGQRYPAAPTFGVPCPTTIFTIGILFFAADPVPWLALVIPVLWSGIATTAALNLNVPEDFGLTVAGLFALGLLIRSLTLGRTASRTKFRIPSSGALKS